MGPRYAFPVPATDLARTLDATFLNSVANHPDVRPWLGGEGPLDLSALIADPANIAVVAEHGGFLGVALGAGRYEIHSLFLPEGRGAEACAAMRAGLDYLFAATDAVDLVTKVPLTNRAASALTIRAGFTPRFMSRMPWTSAADLVDAAFFGLTVEQWALRSETARTLGQTFHDHITAALTAHRSTAPVHADDDVHDRMAGAAVLLCRAGNARKAVQVYNAWAPFACYARIHLVTEQPIVLDLETAVVEVRHQEMEILLCR